MGLGPIPWTSFLLYAAREGWEEDVADYLWTIIHDMDEGYLEYASKKAGNGGGD